MDLVSRVEETALRDADVVAAFPGPGLVGGIAVESLLEDLRLDPVGSLGGEALPASALVEQGRLFWPVLLFARPGLVVVKAEADVDGAAAHLLGRELARLLRRGGARSLTVIDGLPGLEPEDEPHVWAAATDARLLADYERAGATLLEDGALGGGAAAALLWADEERLPAGALAVAARPHLPDPRAAARVLEVLARLLDLEIDGVMLERRGQELEEAFLRIVQEATVGAGERDGSMYT